MNPEQLFEDAMKRGMTSVTDALALFDLLDTVDLDSLIGRWRGSGFPTGHAMDGSLEAFKWFGKDFVDAENVHPLLFCDRKNRIFTVDPARIPMGLAMRVSVKILKPFRDVFLGLRWWFGTKRSRARMRMTEYRGKMSATMIYDDLPINDIFRKVDENTLLGAMDQKGYAIPFSLC